MSDEVNDLTLPIQSFSLLDAPFPIVEFEADRKLRHWSNWQLHPQNRKFYRVRVNDEDEYDYEWASGETEQILVRHYQTQASASLGHRRRDSGWSGPSNQASWGQGQSSFNMDSLRRALPGNSGQPHYAAGYRPSHATNEDTLDDEDDEDEDEDEDEDKDEEDEEEDEAERREPRLVSGSNHGPETEELDPRYKRVKNKDQNRFFTHGRVFLVLWTEPASSTDPNAPRKRGSTQTQFSIVQYGQRAFTEIRRFIVVQPGERHSLCVPIQTYNGRGVVDRGDDAVHHTVAYTMGLPLPVPLPEEHINKSPIRIVRNPRDPSSDFLGQMSRINFSKTYTVEHNVKVRDAGRVHRDDEHLLDTYWKYTTFGVHCSRCTANGQTVWIRPGYRCYRCGSSY